MASIDSMCCICLKVNNNILQDILAFDTDGLSLINKLAGCNFKTEWLDIHSTVPLKICNNCSACLKITYEFRILCEQNHNIIKNYLSTYKLNLNADKIKTIEIVETNNQDLIKDVQDERLDSATTEYTDLDLPNATNRTNVNETEYVTTINNTTIDKIRLKENNLTNFLPIENYADEIKTIEFVGINKQDLIKQEVQDEILDLATNEYTDLNPALPNITNRTSVNITVEPEYVTTVNNTTITESNSTNFLPIENYLKNEVDSVDSDTESDDSISCSSCDCNGCLKCISSKKYFICAVCQKQFKTESSIIKHNLVSDHLSCSFCSKSIKSKNDLQLHLETHSRFKPYRCEYCNKIFSSKRRLKIHYETHQGKKYACNKCPMQFNFIDKLRKHKEIHIPKFTCKECGKIYSNKDHYMRHLKLHEIKTCKQICYYCNEFFATGFLKHQHTVKVHLLQNAIKK